MAASPRKSHSSNCEMNEDTMARDDLSSESIDPMQIDDTLPPGWGRHCVQRASGVSAGKWDVYLISPDGRKFKSRGQLQAYFDRKNMSNLHADDFDFTVRGRSNFGLRVKKGDNEKISDKKKKKKKKAKIKSPDPVHKKSPTKISALDSRLVVKMNFDFKPGRGRKKKGTVVANDDLRSESNKELDTNESETKSKKRVRKSSVRNEATNNETVEFKDSDKTHSPSKRKLPSNVISSVSPKKAKRNINGEKKEVDLSDVLAIDNVDVSSVSNKKPKVKEATKNVNTDNKTKKVTKPKLVKVDSAESVKTGTKQQSLKKKVSDKVSLEPKKRGRKKGSKNQIKKEPTEKSRKGKLVKQKITSSEKPVARKRSKSETDKKNFHGMIIDRQLSDSIVTELQSSGHSRTILRGPCGTKVETDVINGQKVTYVTVMPPKGSGEYIVLDSGHTYAKKPRYIISKMPVTSPATHSAHNPGRVVLTTLSSSPKMSLIKPIATPEVEVAAYETVGEGT